MTNTLDLMATIAREAGALLKANYELPQTIIYKDVVDLVTATDTASETLILARLRAAFPEDTIYAEESGAHVGGGAGTGTRVWLVDPLDGTTNFAHGFPCFCVTLALAERDAQGGLTPVLGVIYDPLRDELFSAERGAGAYRNGQTLRVSQTTELGRALLTTGFPYNIRTVGAPDDNLDTFAAVHLRAQAVRRPGSAALDLAYVAAGRFDGYWERLIKPWDIAAGVLCVQEAGGRVTRLAGEPQDLSGRGVVATNGPLHAELLAVLGAVGR